MTADDMRQYVNHMKHEGVFGDGIMLSAAAMLHGRPVVVFAAEGPSSVQHVDLSADAQVLGPPIYLGLYCEHYVSVKPLRVSEVESPLPTDVFRDSSHLNPRKHLQDFASVTEPMLVDQTQTQCDVGIYAGTSCDVDDYTKCQLLQNHWTPPKGFKFPFSTHNKKGRIEKRYLSQSHLDQYPWLVFSPSKNGLFCKYCPLFVTGAVGGIQKNVPLQQLVTKPLTTYAKLLGKTGDFSTHNGNRYHAEAVQAANDFLNAYHNPSGDILNQLSTQRAKQAAENRQRLKPIIDSIIFLGRQNIPLRGHRDDGCMLDQDGCDSSTVNQGNFRELLKFRVKAGDKALETHLQTASARATYISKTVQNQLISCCGDIILSTIVKRVNSSPFYSILFDETTDMCCQAGPFSWERPIALSFYTLKT